MAAKKSTSKKTATKRSGSKAKKTHSKKSSRKTSKKTSRKASKKGSKARSPPKMNYTPEEQACIDYVQARIKENVPKIKTGEFKHIAQAVAVSYNEMRAQHGECADFYDREKSRKDQLKAERRAAKKSRRRSSRKSRGKTGSKKRNSAAPVVDTDTESL